jgi:hypothetical protein
MVKAKCKRWINSAVMHGLQFQEMCLARTMSGARGFERLDRNEDLRDACYKLSAFQQTDDVIMITLNLAAR